MEIVDVNHVNYAAIAALPEVRRRRGNQGRKNGPVYHDCVCAFDIETTRYKFNVGGEQREHSFMYIWQFQVDDMFTVMGRTWDEYLTFLWHLDSVLPDGRSLVIYVHNLSYEFQFLKGIYDFTTADIFAIDARKVLKCKMYDGRFEYRCSMMLSNSNLKDFTHSMKVKHPKLPDYDYDGIRWPWTELTDEELAYCQNDVLGLVEAVYALMERDHDNLYSIPLTSTGYVRRDMKRALHNCTWNPAKKMRMDWELYEALTQAFRGGNTHSNRYFADNIIYDVRSADRSSSYPDVIVNCPFPSEPFKKFENWPILDDQIEQLRRQKYAVLAYVTLTDVQLLDEYWGCPYIPSCKVTGLIGATIDNGRVISCRQCRMYITDVDYLILLSEYSFKLTIEKLWYSKYRPLPKPITDTVISYYKKKTMLKGVSGEINGVSAEALYGKNKALLNSCYGMMATSPVRVPLEFHQDGEFQEHEERYDPDDPDSPVNEAAQELYLMQLLAEANSKAFLSYSWGIWTTAWARLRLEEGIRLAGDNFIYADTDSVKYIGDIDWSAFNDRRIADSTKTGAYADDPKGNRHYMGVFEQEEGYTEFKTLGAKKYAGRYADGHLVITIAGVGKEEGSAFLDSDEPKYIDPLCNGEGHYENVKGLDAMKEGLTFTGPAGGVELLYNDDVQFDAVVDGHVITVTDNAVIRPSRYTLGLTSDYKKIIQMSKITLAKITKVH